MRWLVTLLLLALVVVGGVWLAARDRVRTAVGVPDPSPAAAPAESFAVLDQYLRPEKVQKLEVKAPGHPPLTLTRNPDGSWSSGTAGCLPASGSNRPTRRSCCTR